MRSPFRVFVCLLAVGYAAVVADAQEIHPAEHLRLTVDIARFRGADDQQTHVELYYAFPRRGLTYLPDSAGYGGAADIAVWISRKDSTLLAERWLVPHRVRDTVSATPGTNLVGVFTFQVPAGEYQVKILIRDRHNLARRDSLLLRLPIRIYGTAITELSDLELAASIRQGGEGGPFFKNTLEVVPNVGGLYNEDQRCFYYAEAYNLFLGDDRSDFLVRTRVLDAVGKEILSRERARKRVGESSVIVDQFGVENFRTGTYQIIVSMLDSTRKQLSTSARKFFVYNSRLGVDSSLVAGGARLPMGEYMAMDEAEVDREFRWSRYDMTDEEKNQYKAITGLEVKRKFMSDFWRRRPPGAREEYLARVSYANANFAVMAREGFRADRGRVYIVYGQPDDVERHPNETDMRPYEIWQYNNIQGGVIFVFVQKNSGGDYELVHSTHRNELRDENWDRVGVTR